MKNQPKPVLMFIVSFLLIMSIVINVAAFATIHGLGNALEDEVQKNKVSEDKIQEIHNLVLDLQAPPDYPMLMEELQKIIQQNQAIHAKEGKMEQEAASFSQKKFDDVALDVRYLVHDTKILYDSAAEETKRRGPAEEQNFFGPLIRLQAKMQEAHDAALFLNNIAFQ